MSKLLESDPWVALRRFTPARIALGRAGHSLPTDELLRFGLAHAQARDAVHLPFEPHRLESALAELGVGSIVVRSAAADRFQYLRRPDLGRRLDEPSRQALDKCRSDPAPDLVLVVADGLSSHAVHRHAVPLLTLLLPPLRAESLRAAPIVIAEQGRVALGDDVGEVLGAGIAAVLIGERPGLSSPDSLGIYLTYAPKVGRLDSERNCISNVRPVGLSYEDAADKLVYLVREARRLRLTGIALKDDGAVPSLSHSG